MLPKTTINPISASTKINQLLFPRVDAWRRVRDTDMESEPDMDSDGDMDSEFDVDAEPDMDCESDMESDPDADAELDMDSEGDMDLEGELLDDSLYVRFGVIVGV
jgi:hypothetical protein